MKSGSWASFVAAGALGPLEDPETAVETCGYCGGSGHVPGRQYDDEGRHRPEWPAMISCEYCGARRLRPG